jgi:hypothetical protein
VRVFYHELLDGLYTVSAMYPTPLTVRVRVILWDCEGNSLYNCLLPLPPLGREHPQFRAYLRALACAVVDQGRFFSEEVPAATLLPVLRFEDWAAEQ